MTAQMLLRSEQLCADCFACLQTPSVLDLLRAAIINKLPPPVVPSPQSHAAQPVATQVVMASVEVPKIKLYTNYGCPCEWVVRGNVGEAPF
jgi:hypothetical protein